MNLRLSLKLLFSFKRKTFHSFFLILSSKGIFLGILSLILIISFMDSAQKNIKENYLKEEPHIYIEAKNGFFFEENFEFEKKIKNLKGQIYFDKVLEIDGINQDFKGKIIGKDKIFKTTMPFGEIGKTICFTIPQISLTPFGPSLKKLCLEKEKEGAKVFVPLKKLQNLLGKEKMITAYQIFLKNPEEIKKNFEEIKKFLPENLKGETIYDKKAPILYALKIEKISMVSGVFLILFVSIFQLYFSLKLLFYHYQSIWALFKAFGLPLKKIKNTFKYFCFYIFSISYLFSLFFSFAFIKIQNKKHFFPFPEEIEHFKYLNYKFPFLESFFIFLFLILLSFIIGEMIGSQSKKMNFQEILRVPQ